MRLLKTLIIGAAAGAALVVAAPAANAAPTTNEITHGVTGALRLGPFATLAECNRSRREWDITHVVGDCWYEDIAGRIGWYFHVFL